MLQHHLQAEIVLAMAIGDKAIRAAIIDRADCAHTFQPSPLPPHADCAAILRAMRSAIAAAGAIDAVGIVLPSPSIAADDYETGSTTPREHDLIAALQECDWPIELSCAIPLRVIHHCNAVLLGEVHAGAVQGCRRAAAVIIGHGGVDSAMIIDGQLLCDPLGAPAAIVRIADRPCRNGRVADTLCGRALLSRMPDTHSLAELETRARAGDFRCQRLWTDFGLDLAETLQAWQADLLPDQIILGGPIARALPLFRNVLGDLPVVAATLPDAALVGAATIFA
ncbi:MAG: ROK family protein [Lentisphaeria bacterium]|nr:ROK family protein [Lentisphaeria bacterium]